MRTRPAHPDPSSIAHPDGGRALGGCCKPAEGDLCFRGSVYWGRTQLELTNGSYDDYRAAYARYQRHVRSGE